MIAWGRGSDSGGGRVGGVSGGGGSHGRLYCQTASKLNVLQHCLSICSLMHLSATRVRASHELGGFWRVLVTHYFYGESKTNTGRVSRPMSNGFSW